MTPFKPQAGQAQLTVSNDINLPVNARLSDQEHSEFIYEDSAPNPDAHVPCSIEPEGLRSGLHLFRKSSRVSRGAAKII